MIEIKPIEEVPTRELRKIVEAIVHKQGLHPGFYWPTEQLLAEIATAEGLVLLDQGLVKSFVLYRCMPDIWEISVVATHPLYAGQGFAEILLRSMVKNKHNNSIWLEVHCENCSAQKLYEKVGFKKVGERPRYYRDGSTAYLYSVEGHRLD